MRQLWLKGIDLCDVFRLYNHALCICIVGKLQYSISGTIETTCFENFLDFADFLDAWPFRRYRLFSRHMRFPRRYFGRFLDAIDKRKSTFRTRSHEFFSCFTCLYCQMTCVHFNFSRTIWALTNWANRNWACCSILDFARFPLFDSFLANTLTVSSVLNVCKSTVSTVDFYCVFTFLYCYMCLFFLFQSKQLIDQIKRIRSACFNVSSTANVSFLLFELL